MIVYSHYKHQPNILKRCCAIVTNCGTIATALANSKGF
jgi:hypothetical protein